MGEAVIPKILGRSDSSALMYESLIILSVGSVMPWKEFEQNHIHSTNRA